MPKPEVSHSYTEKVFDEGMSKMPASKRQNWGIAYGTEKIPAGHKAIKVSKIHLHAPANLVDSLHSQIMGKKTDKDPKKPESDKKEPKMKAEKMRNVVADHEAMTQRQMRQQSRNDAN
jgi:hypothetical protein